MVGVRPVADSLGRVNKLEVIPLEELGRPRVDVVVNCSGVFRDLFVNQVRGCVVWVYRRVTCCITSISFLLLLRLSLIFECSCARLGLVAGLVSTYTKQVSPLLPVAAPSNTAA